jgi:hypothetical protein
MWSERHASSGHVNADFLPVFVLYPGKEGFMPQWATTVIVILVVVAVAEAAWILLQRRRSDHLRRRFGPEYVRTVEERGNRLRAEADLTKRERRVEKLHIRPLPSRDRERFTEAWRRDQARFVDDPKGAVTEADKLVTEVMKLQGYPVSDFEQRVADISVDHAQVVDNYRAADAIARRHERGEATTEDLRKAMVYYRELFNDLLEMQEVRR